MNDLETPRHRQSVASITTEEFLAKVTTTNILTLASSVQEHGIIAVTANSTYSTISLAMIWLQERGVVIPADICAALEIEDVRHAQH